MIARVNEAIRTTLTRKLSIAQRGTPGIKVRVQPVRPDKSLHYFAEPN